MIDSTKPDNTVAPTRVLFYGVTGTGKPTAAHRYSQITGLPEFSADDDIGWLPGWSVRELDEERAIAGSIAAQDRWVPGSVYGNWSDLVVPRAPAKPPVMIFRRPGELADWFAELEASRQGPGSRP